MLGFKIFTRLLWLVVGLIGLLTLYGFLTFPRIEDIQTLAGAGAGPQALEAYAKARADWLSSVKDLGQIFLVTPIVPLLSAVLGYMFGRNETGSGDPEE